MAHHMTFQEICTRQEVGFVCDKESMAPLTLRESFNDLIIKLASKCEMNLVFLGGKEQVARFSIDVVPEDPVHGTAVTITKSKGCKGMGFPKGCEAVASACQQCVANGYHGLHAITKLDASNMPDNASRKMYSFAQFVNFLVHGLEAYFMFVKANEQFALNAMNLWETLEDAMMEGCYIVMVWQYVDDTKKASAPRMPLSSFINNIKEPEPVKEPEPEEPEVDEPEVDEPVRQVRPMKAVTSVKQIKQAVALVKEEPAKPVTKTTSKITKSTTKTTTTTKRETRGRRSIAPPVQETNDASSEEEDEEITFKNLPQVQYHPNISMNESNSSEENISPKKLLQNISPKRSAPEKPSVSPKKAKSMEADSSVASKKEDPSLDDFTFGFDKPAVKTVGRKSTGRKSLVPDWPEEEKEDILYFFDNLNPSQTEQSRVALTCKYTTMKYSRDLSSKTLYQWVQKKGRTVNKEVTSYDLPESQHQETTVTFFKLLGSDLSETSRIAFTCKYMQTQYGVSVTSKNLYDWLNDKGKKSTRRR